MNPKNKAGSQNEQIILDLLNSGLEKNSEGAEISALSLAKLSRKENPIFAKKILEILASRSLRGGATRSFNHSPLPTDQDSQLEMVNIISPSGHSADKPILSASLNEKIHSFLEERKNLVTLLEHEVKPSTNLLFIGQPGTGKTMLAHYIAATLGKELVILDLSTSISSFLGKTGLNLKKVLQYARQNSSVLLLDEFDAIAKRRDDSTDLGEIKRIVNVLLMELESWPPSSIVIATSNHPELLDRAIWRRFDQIFELGLPEHEERTAILSKSLEKFFSREISDSKKIFNSLSKLLVGKSPSDICRFADSVKRRIILKKEEPIVACLHELELYTGDKKIRGKFCIVAKSLLGDKMTVRELSIITGLSVAGVQHHLAKNQREI